MISKVRSTAGRRALAASATLVCGVVVLSGCTSGTSGSASSSENAPAATSAAVSDAPAAETAASGPVKIGLAMKTQLQRRWGFDETSMMAECEKLGAECIVQWANDDAAKQASQVENLLSQGIDVLVLVPVNGEAGKALVEKAHAQNVKVVDYDEFVPGSDFFVTRDNAAVGRAQAEEALAFAPDGNWAIVKGDEGNPVAQEINAAYQETLKGKPINIVYEQFTKNWDPATAQTAAEGVLSANNDDVKVFLTSNDGMASGVVQALKGRGLNGKVYVSGLDADPTNLKAIAAGDQIMTVWTKLDVWGQKAIQAAVQLANGQTPTPDTEQGGVPTALAPIEVVTKDNLCEWIKSAPKGWTTVEEVFGSPTC